MIERGFLGYDASLMLDVVVCALALIGPVLVWSISQVRSRRRFKRHRTVQLLLAALLFTAVGLFELDMKLQGGWEQIVNRDPEHPRLTGAALDEIRTVLNVHLCFAITTPILWLVTIALAMWKFPNPPVPGRHSRLHAVLGSVSAIDLILTSLTGVVFYYMAFVRTAV